MTALVDAFLALGVLGGCVLCWIAARTARLSARLGRRSFVAFAGTVGIGCLVAGMAGLLGPPVGFDVRGAVWPQIPLWFWLFATVPWFVFALQYTGTRTRIRPRAVALLALPYGFVLFQLGWSLTDSGNAVFSSLGSLTFIYTVALVAGGAYLLVQAAHVAGHVPLGQGVAAAAAPIAPLIVWNAMTPPAEMAPAGRAGVFATGTALAALSLGVAIARYDLFEATPAAGTLGRRGLIEETDDPMFVVDDDGRVVEHNGTAAAVLPGAPDALGAPIADAVGHGVDALQDAGTVTLRTAAGERRYDPQVSTVRDHHGNDLGATVSLRDVTERERREQRLAVLNRVLRHNLRNEVDVVKGNAEAIEGGDGKVDAILDAADAVTDLGNRARRIDRFIAESADPERVDLGRLVEDALETVDTADLRVAVDAPASASIVANERALTGAVESAVDNAVSYADAAVSVDVDCRPEECVVRVADDGPGIPQRELDALDSGSESALRHSTGLGLWQLKWAVVTLDGELSFETGEDGTVVEIAVPDADLTRA